MIAKIAVIFGLIAAAHASGLYGSTAIGYAGGLGYGSYGYGSNYYGVSPYSYTAPIVKTVAPVSYATPIAYTPAVSSVSQYSIHQATPIVKSYAPVAYTSYASPYLSHGYAPAASYASYGGYGHGGYGYGGYGYGGKYAW